MTTVLESSVAEAYQQVFGSIATEEDQKRIDFLECVVEDKISLGQQEMSIEQAQRIIQSESNDTKQIAEIDLMSYMGRWYKSLETKPDQTGTNIAIRGHPEYITSRLNDCKEVLRKHHTKYNNQMADMLEPLYAAFKLKNGTRDRAVRNAAARLIETGDKNIINAVMKELIPYNNQLKQNLDDALAAGNTRNIESSAQVLVDSKNTELQQYVREKLGSYKLVREESVQSGEGKTKKITSRYMFKVEGDKIAQEIVPQTRWKLALGIGLIAATIGIAAAAYSGVFTEKSDNAKDKSNLYIQQK